MNPPREVTWTLDRLDRIGEHPVRVLGSPRLIESPHGPAVLFDGFGDGLVIDANPLAGAVAFEVEALFRPDPGGLPEQRFLHVQADDREDRALLETRLNGTGSWYADTFIRSGNAEQPLNDPTLLHPLGTWHRLSLSCDGRRMQQRVNGRLELQASVAFEPMTPGRVSIGARLNRVFWFKGAIRSIRFRTEAR